MHINPEIPINDVLPFTERLPESKAKLPRSIKIKIFSFLETIDLSRLTQTCKEIHEIIKKTESLNYCSRALSLLKHSYLMGKNIEKQKDIHFIGTKSEWLANIAIALFPHDSTKSLQVAQESIALITNEQPKFPEFFAKNCATLADKFALCYPNLAEEIVTQAFHCLEKVTIMDKNLKIKMTLLPKLHSIYKDETCKSIIKECEECINKHSKGLQKAEYLCTLAAIYENIDSTENKRLMKEAYSTVSYLTPDQKHNSLIQQTEWRDCIDRLFGINEPFARFVVTSFTTWVCNAAYPSPVVRMQYFAFICAMLFRSKMDQEAKGMANRIDQILNELKTEKIDTKIKNKLWLFAASAFSSLDPIKCITLLTPVINSENDIEMTEIIHMSLGEIYFDIARSLSYLTEDAFSICAQSLNNYLNSKYVDPQKKELIVSAYCISIEAKCLQPMCGSNNIEINSVKGMDVKTLSPEMKVRSLGRIAINRVQHHLTKRALAKQENEKDILSIGLSGFDFKNVQAILDQMENGFTKARVMAEISELMLGGKK